MVVPVLLLALLGQITCATHSGWSLPKRNSKKSFLEAAMKEMNGIESLTKPPRIPPRVIKVLIGPEHPHFKHHRHRHHHHHHHHLFNRHGHFSFPPRPTKPHIGPVKGRNHGKNRTSKLIYDAAYFRQAVRLLVEIKKKLSSSDVKKTEETHLKRNRTSNQGPKIALTENSISMLPEIRSIVQRDKDVSGQARAAFAKARQIIDKTHSVVHPADPSTTQRVRNDTKITKEANISSAVSVLADAVQKAAESHTVDSVKGAGTTPGVQDQREKGLNTTGHQQTLLSVLENIKRNLTHHKGDFDSKFGKVISYLRTLSNVTSSATTNATAPATGKSKENTGLLTNKAMLDIQDNRTNKSGSVLKESVSKSTRSNKTAVPEQYTDPLNKLLQHNVGSNHGNGLVPQDGSVKKHDNNNNNNNNRTTALDHSAESLTKVLQHKPITSDQATKPVPQNASVVNDSHYRNNNNNNRSTVLEHLAKSLTKILQNVSLVSHHSNATTHNARNPEVVTGEVKYLLASGQANHTTAAKLPKQRLASRKAFGLAMKLVKAAVAREELRKAEQELFSKMKEMTNKTAETSKANQKLVQPEKLPQEASSPSADSSSSDNPASTGSAPNAPESKPKNKKQDSESQQKYNEAAHLEEKIAAQQDKMYNNLVNRILGNDDNDYSDEGDEAGTARELPHEQNEDFGDFKDSDEDMDERAYGSNAGDAGRYTLRDVVLKPEVLSISAQGQREGHKINISMNTSKRKRTGTVKKRHRGQDRNTDASADYENSREGNHRPLESKQRRRVKNKGETTHTKKYTMRKGNPHHRPNRVHRLL